LWHQFIRNGAKFAGKPLMLSNLKKLLTSTLEAASRVVSRPRAEEAGVAAALTVTRQLMGLGRLDEAFRCIRRAYTEFPHAPAVARCYRRVKLKHSGALAREAQRLARSFPTGENQAKVCELLRLAGRWRQALRVVRRAESSFPESWQVKLVLGKLHYDRFLRRRTDRDGWSAVEFLEQTRALNPRSYEASLILGITLTRLGSYDGAKAVVEEILSGRPSDAHARGLMAFIARKLEGPAASPADWSERPVVGPVAASQADRQLLDRVLALPGAVGAFLLDPQGKVRGSLVRQRSAFDFSIPAEVFESMAGSLRLDTRRIGLGNLLWCSVAGEGWHLGFLGASESPVMAFFQGDATADQVEAWLENAVAGVEPVGEAEVVGAGASRAGVGFLPATSPGDQRCARS
jgi:tetratricopeptide (TPR) repeat protein